MTGPDLRGAGRAPGLQPTESLPPNPSFYLSFMLVVYDLVLMHWWRHAYDRAEETQLNPSVRYKAESFLLVIDQFIASLDQRLETYNLLACQFGCSGCLSTLSPEELLTAAKALVESYPNDLDIDEVYHFAKLLIYLKTMNQETSAVSYFCTN